MFVCITIVATLLSLLISIGSASPFSVDANILLDEPTSAKISLFGCSFFSGPSRIYTWPFQECAPISDVWISDPEQNEEDEPVRSIKVENFHEGEGDVVCEFFDGPTCSGLRTSVFENIEINNLFFESVRCFRDAPGSPPPSGGTTTPTVTFQDAVTPCGTFAAFMALFEHENYHGGDSHKYYIPYGQCTTVNTRMGSRLGDQPSTCTPMKVRSMSFEPAIVDCYLYENLGCAGDAVTVTTDSPNYDQLSNALVVSAFCNELDPDFGQADKPDQNSFARKQSASPGLLKSYAHNPRTLSTIPKNPTCWGHSEMPSIIDGPKSEMILEDLPLLSKQVQHNSGSGPPYFVLILYNKINWDGECRKFIMPFDKCITIDWVKEHGTHPLSMERESPDGDAVCFGCIFWEAPDCTGEKRTAAGSVQDWPLLNGPFEFLAARCRTFGPMRFDLEDFVPEF